MSDYTKLIADKDETQDDCIGDEEDIDVRFRQSKRKVLKPLTTEKIAEDEIPFLREQLIKARRVKASKESDDEENVKKKRTYEEDNIQFTKIQLATLTILFSMLLFTLYEREYMHICALRFYAHVAGDMDCQHTLGQRYYSGQGVPRNKTTAMYWFKQAAAQGHPHASYNLAVAHIQGFWRLERKGEAHDLIKHAASHGVREAEHILNTACVKGECDR